MKMSFTALALVLCLWQAVADPEPFRVQFHVNVPSGNKTFTVVVEPVWAPLGAKRFEELLSKKFFNGLRFFRVLKGFMCQFGISGSPEIAKKYQRMNIRDDPVLQSNTRGTMSFATAGPNTRTSQLFINFADNSFLDNQGFSPFAKVVSGMDVVNQIYDGYGEQPSQGEITARGNAYLNTQYPRLSYIISANRVFDDLDTAVEPPLANTQREDY